MENKPIPIAQTEQLRGQGELAKAESIYRKILANHPQSYPAYHGLSLIAIDVGNYPLAIQMIINAISINGNIPLYYSD